MSEARAIPSTIRDLVQLLGGPSRVGRALGVTTEAVCNWTAKDQVPAARAVPLWRMAHAAGLGWRPPGFEGLALVPQDVPVQQDQAA